MVDRCGFYIDGGNIGKKVVQIKWDQGFSQFAKLGYIDYVYDALQSEGFNNVLDVTSANISYQNGRILSPLFMYLDGKKVEDYYAETKGNIDNQFGRIMYFEWLYFNALTEKQIMLINQYDVFVDVFHKPGGCHATQAKACAIYKLLMKLGNVSIVKMPSEYFAWRTENVEFQS